MVTGVWTPEKKKAGWLLGMGYWVQGFRGFPWTAVYFYLKDVVKVEPSTLQLLLATVNFPMVVKPLYGILSDAFYIRGQHRIPYIAFGALLQVISWLALAIFSPSSNSIFSLTLFLLLTNFGASIAEVANEAIVAELGKQPTSSSKGSQPSSTGELQSFVWIAGSFGGALGNLLGGIAIDRFSPQTMFLFFGLIVALQFFLTVTVRESSINLPKNPSSVGIRKQLSDLSVALQKPDIVSALTWLALSFAIIPSLTGNMFFYQTQYLKIDPSVLGISKVFGQAAIILWSFIYNRYLKSIQARKLVPAIQATLAVFMFSDIIFVKGIYRGMGVPDSLYVIIFSGLLEVLFIFKILPFSVLVAQLCPPGCEGSLMALAASVVAFALIVSGYLGVALASFVGVTGDNFSSFPLAILIQVACTLFPILWSSYIPEDKKAKKSE